MHLFLDLEVSTKTWKIKEIWWFYGNEKLKSFSYKSKEKFINEILNNLPEDTYIFWHNILNFDQNFLPQIYKFKIIDSLFLSALFFPKKPYHKLVKSYKDKQIWTKIENNPIKDTKLVFDLINDILSKIKTYDKNWARFLLSSENKIIKNFTGFLEKNNKLKIEKVSDFWAKSILKEYLKNKVCENVFDNFFHWEKIEFMIACNFLYEADRESIPPKFLNFNDNFYNILDFLVSSRCNKCDFCTKHNSKFYLKKYFWYDNFRKFDWKDLQKQAVEQALSQEDLLVIFPTWWGKSLTFQLPALIKAEQTRKMTIIISPLLSLMKDQVENLRKKWISNVAYFNSLQNSLEISQTHKAIQSGSVDILYLSPEKLQNQSVRKSLAFRKVDRVVIDEAHCFSKWGHDFRVDYLFIANFIKEISKDDIQVSCFTATAKKQVIEDIQAYFTSKLGKNLKLISASPNRNNLSFTKLECKNDNEKFDNLLNLINDKESTIVFTNTTTKAKELANQLKDEWFSVGYYHWKLETDEKIKIQDEFISWKINTIIATNAFGMWVDKDNVRKVIHWEIPSSLENYLQEVWRAWRDNQESNCYILYNQDDIEKIFQIQRMSEITENQFRSLFRYLKNIWKYWDKIKRSYSTLAVKMWLDIEKDENWQTKIKVALAVLEEKIEFIKRDRQYTTKLFTWRWKKWQNLETALEEIDNLKTSFDKDLLKSIYSYIFSNYWVELSYLVEVLDYDEKNFNKKRQKIIDWINILIENKFLSSDTEYKVIFQSKYFSSPYKALELVEKIIEFLKLKNNKNISYKQIVDYFVQNKLIKNKNQQNILLDFLNIYLTRDRKFLEINQDEVKIKLKEKHIDFLENKLLFYSYKILEFLEKNIDKNKEYIEFLDTDIVEYFKQNKIAIEDKNLKIVQEILYFLHIHNIINVKDGLRWFEQIIVFSIIAPNKNYEKWFYKILKQHYESKYQQAHIIDEWIKNWENEKLYQNSLPNKNLVEDYFNLDIDDFIWRYFPNKKRIFKKPISEQKYEILLKSLDKNQRQVINENWNLLIIAWPGAGKTKTLVHKIASLILQEWVKEEEFLMLTFSNSAKYEIKKRLLDILWNSAYWLDVHTFHSFCYKTLEISAKTINPDEVISKTIEELNSMENKLQKQVIVIDEYQDVNKEQFELIQAIINNCIWNVRIIASGDDDQNIYAFTGANLKYINEFEEKFNAKTIYLDKNYRSKPEIVNFSQKWINQIENRKKKNLKLKSVYEDTLFEQSNIELIELQENKLNSILEVNKYLKKNTAYLTFLNQRAEIVSSYLKNKNIDHKLLTNKEKFKFYHLIEVQDFLKYLEQEPFEIYDKIFNLIMKKLELKYKNSPYLDYIRKMYEDFCLLNTKLYKSKLEEFVYDWEFPQKNIFVGTLHKSKWLEFETVIIDLFGIDKLDEEIIRLLYVWFTRAKTNLKIVWTSKNIVFKKIKEILNKEAKIWKSIKIDKYETYFWLEDMYLWENKLAFEQNFSQINLMQNYILKEDGIYFLHKKLQSFSKKWKETIKKLEIKNIEKVSIYAKCVYKDEYLVYLPRVVLRI